MIFQVFIPTAIMVALSWFSFLLPKTSHPGRVGTLVTLILVLIQINVMVVHESPVLSGLCGLTVWTTICLCMVGYLKYLSDIYLVLRTCLYFDISCSNSSTSVTIVQYDYLIGCACYSGICNHSLFA